MTLKKLFLVSTEFNKKLHICKIELDVYFMADTTSGSLKS